MGILPLVWEQPQRKSVLVLRLWLEDVELAEKCNELVKILSGGMKRQLQIARALLHQPQILFLDEPTVELDPQTRRSLWEIIRDLNQQGDDATDVIWMRLNFSAMLFALPS